MATLLMLGRFHENILTVVRLWKTKTLDAEAAMKEIENALVLIEEDAQEELTKRGLK